MSTVVSDEFSSGVSQRDLGVDTFIEAGHLQDGAERLTEAGLDEELAAATVDGEDQGALDMVEDLEAGGVDQLPAGWGHQGPSSAPDTALEQAEDETMLVPAMSSGDSGGWRAPIPGMASTVRNRRVVASTPAVRDPLLLGRATGTTPSVTAHTI